MTWVAWAGIAVAFAGFVLVALSAYGAARWGGRTRELNAQLEAQRRAPSVASFDPRELDGLPPPVRRYFHAVLKPGQPVITAVSVGHAGLFNLGESGDRWTPFTSMQRVVTGRPGFVWDARIRILPGLAVLVHDAYVAGEGILHPALAGVFTLMDLRGTGDIAQGELMRFLAEAAWYPTALLPSQGVRWAARDDRSATATLGDGATELTLVFAFSGDGLIEHVRAEARGRTVGGRVVPTSWEGRWSNWQERDGLRIPLSGEVAWLLPGGRRPYWRGTITSLAYEFAR